MRLISRVCGALSSGIGVVVLDMADPAHPQQTALLTEVPMLSPHESLSLNTARGLLAAVSGNPAAAPGLVSLYDLHQDCRHPEPSPPRSIGGYALTEEL